MLSLVFDWSYVHAGDLFKAVCFRSWVDAAFRWGAAVLAESVDDSGSDDRKLSIKTRSSGRKD